MSTEHDAVLADLNLTSDRDRIARDLHYLVLARLDATRLMIEQGRDESEPADAAVLLAEAVRMIDRTKEDIREAVLEWRGSDGSLVVEMREVVETYESLMKFAPTIELAGPVARVPERVADDIVPVLREALSNIARHAAADAGEVELRVTDDEVVLTVVDDGVGLPATDSPENGLRHARRRAESLGGSLELGPRHPRGTTFVWRVPLT